MPWIRCLGHIVTENKELAHVDRTEKLVRLFLVVRGYKSQPEIHSVTLSSVIHAIKVTDSLIANQSGKGTGRNASYIRLNLNPFGNQSIVADNIQSNLPFLADLLQLLGRWILGG